LDTFANIYTTGLLGEQYIGLEAGGDEVVLKNGDKIDKTQDAIVLEKMISQFLFSKASETEAKADVKAAAPVGAELDILK
jgi:phospholipid/cholesterol/gamma-HCH transport system substrate-binding protein